MQVFEIFLVEVGSDADVAVDFAVFVRLVAFFVHQCDPTLVRRPFRSSVHVELVYGYLGHADEVVERGGSVVVVHSQHQVVHVRFGADKVKRAVPLRVRGVVDVVRRLRLLRSNSLRVHHRHLAVRVGPAVVVEVHNFASSFHLDP